VQIVADAPASSENLAAPYAAIAGQAITAIGELVEGESGGGETDDSGDGDRRF